MIGKLRSSLAGVGLLPGFPRQAGPVQRSPAFLGEQEPHRLVSVLAAITVYKVVLQRPLKIRIDRADRSKLPEGLIHGVILVEAENIRQAFQKVQEPSGQSNSGFR